MENNQQNLLFQMKNMLNELSNYVYKINDVILQMNNLINQFNNPMLSDINNQMNNLNQMNNSFKMMMNNNQMNYNMNNAPIPIIPKDNNNNIINKDDYINIGFKYNHTGGGLDNVLFVSKSLTINELINLYLQKINKSKYVDNYDNYYRFIFNSNYLNNYKEKTIKEMNLNHYCYIYVSETHQLDNSFVA